MSTSGEPRKGLERLYVEFHIATGESFKAQLPEAFKKKLHEAIDKADASMSDKA